MEYRSAKLRHAQQTKGQGEIQEPSELITGRTEPTQSDVSSR